MLDGRTVKALAIGVFVLGLAGPAMAAGPDAALLAAVKTQDAATVRALVRDRPASLNQADADGTTLLHWATDRNDLVVAELLVRAGANVRATSRYGITPIHSAALYGNADMLTLLLKAGADANAATPEGETTLMTAARTGNADAVKVLLAAGAAVNVREGWKQQTALMWAAHEGNVDAATVLIESGASLSDRSVFGWTPFLFAVRQGHDAMIRMLLSAGADINDTLPDGTNALVSAVQSGNFETASLLLELGINPNASAQGWTALHQVAWVRRPQHGWRNPAQTPQGQVGSLDLLRRLVAHGADVNARQTKEPSADLEGRNNFNRFGSTAFSLAAKNVDVPMMRVLLELGADPFLATVEGTSPIMVAAGVGIYSQGENPGQPEEAADAVKLLVDLGASVREVDSNGDTAMHGPAWRGSNETVEILARAGSPLDVKNKYGWSPLTVANGVYYNARIMMNKHTAKLLTDLMRARGLDPGEEASSTNVNASQSGVVKGNAVIEDQLDAANTNEVKQNLLDLQMKHEEALRRILLDMK
jgi:ankyrin repeat protein